MKFIDLFAGVGGFRLGLERAGHQCVWGNEWDKHCQSVYKKHWGDIDGRDIRKVDVGDIPDHELLTGGFPCQPFSLAGKRQGTNEERGTLFEDIVRIARAKRPSTLLLENVKGLLSAQEGYAFYRIISDLEELGYYLEWQVLNSRDFGVPQNRERVFIIGHLADRPWQKIFPIGEDAKKVPRVYGQEGGPTISNSSPREMKFMDECPTILGRDYKDPKVVYDRKGFDSRTKGFRESEGITPTLSTKMGTGGNNVPMVVANRYRTLAGKGECFEVNDISNSLTEVTKDNLIAVPTVVSPFGGFTSDTHCGTLGAGCGISASKTNYVINGLRRLTPVECERLQGFPDDWTRWGPDGKEVADSHRYKMMGNAVTVNVIEVLGKKLMELSR